MKLNTIVLGALITSGCITYAHEDAHILEIAEQSVEASPDGSPQEANEKEQSSIPLWQCFTKPESLVKSPAAIAATVLAVLKIIQGITTYQIQGAATGPAKFEIGIKFLESIVSGYAANWFIQDFLKTCRKKIKKKCD